MKSSARRAVETRRLYRFEEIFAESSLGKVCRERSLPFLRRLLREVWAKHGRARLSPPDLSFGPGTPHGKGFASFAEGYSYIELKEGHRNVLVLLHELTHTLGYGAPHGAGFVRKYIELLVEYGGCSEGELILGAGLFKLNPKGRKCKSP